MDHGTTQRSISQVRWKKKKIWIWSCSLSAQLSFAILIEFYVNEINFVLFFRIKRWGMDSYVYAPKDDYKHRAYWREMYTVEEADHLTSEFNKYNCDAINK